MLYGSKEAPKSLLSFALRFKTKKLKLKAIKWTLFCEKKPQNHEKLQYFFKKMKFFQLQALLEKK